MIVLATDFGLEGPYTGQVKATIYRRAPGIPVINLFADLPAFNIRAAAYLLAAYVNEFPEGTVFLGVVDPGVGSARRPVVLQADGKWFVGPDNGLFNVIWQRAQRTTWWVITEKPQRLSNTFHGRDLFAPVAAGLATTSAVPGEEFTPDPLDEGTWPKDLYQVVYIDRYGNAMAGIRASTLRQEAVLRVHDQVLRYQATFADAGAGQALWYENANGLVEIAVNQGNAASALNLAVGNSVLIG